MDDFGTSLSYYYTWDDTLNRFPIPEGFNYTGMVYYRMPEWMNDNFKWM